MNLGNVYLILSPAFPPPPPNIATLDTYNLLIPG